MGIVNANDFIEMSDSEMQQNSGGFVIFGITITAATLLKAAGITLGAVGVGCFIYGVSTH